MPYINIRIRSSFDKELKLLALHISTPGELNYVISTLCDRVLDKMEMDYASLNAIIGVLESAKLEFYRRIVVPYEDHKAWENNDVYQGTHITSESPHLPRP